MTIANTGRAPMSRRSSAHTTNRAAARKKGVSWWADAGRGDDRGEQCDDERSLTPARARRAVDGFVGARQEAAEARRPAPRDAGTT